MNQKDIITQTIKVLNNKNITIIRNKDDDYIYGAVTVEGGGVFKKGIAIGIQDNMIPGLMIYDDENFYGYSDKYGLCLLSTHPDYNELEIPESIFVEKPERIQASQTTNNNNNSKNFQDLKDTTKYGDTNKSLNIDIDIKDSNNFYITIPSDYNKTKFMLSFDINFLYDLNSIITSINLAFVNESEKPVQFKIINYNCYFEEGFLNTVLPGKINKINMEIIGNNYFIVSQKIFSK